MYLFTITTDGSAGNGEGYVWSFPEICENEEIHKKPKSVIYHHKHQQADIVAVGRSRLS